MPLPAGAHIGPYEILALLGAGGMGEVYRARDTRLQRIIALKTLPAGRVADAGRKQRFLAEAQAASRLNHPNIVTIHDILEENGACFIAMEYVAGATLEKVITPQGLPLKQALKYAAEIADALYAAHSAGILHRDLKPANVIVTDDGRAKLLDFGLAKLIDPALHTALEQTVTLNTTPGVIVGTAAYMSPEQAEGKDLDARSDIFSFGLVLYEMLSGQRAFARDSWLATLTAILHDEPRALRDLNPVVPAFVERQVMRCLSKNPAHRFQSMPGVRQAIEEAATLSAASEERESIAVLPFANLSADKENEYFSDGLAEEIINALAKVPELRVIARTSAFAFRGKEHDLRAVAGRLRVGKILEGSVRRSGNRIRVTTQLIQVADESHLWSERYDRELTDIFAIQDDISAAIANALKVKLAPARHRTASVEAYKSYLKGLYWYQRYTSESLAKAKTAFEDALSNDPGYAPAHAGLAVFYYGIGTLGIARMVEMAPLARSAAEKALAIDPTLSEAHSVLGLLTGAVDLDWKLSERHFHAATAAEPVPSAVRVRYALYLLTPLLRFEEALGQYQCALETDPLSTMVQFGLGSVYHAQRRYGDALQQAQKAMDLFPDHWMAYYAMGLAFSQMGQLEQAITAFETVVRLSPAFNLASGYLAALYARSGNSARADELVEQLRSASPTRYVSPACFALYHAALGQAGDMFEALDAALEERDPYVTRINSEPHFDAFRADPRYRDLLNRMNLGAYT